MRKFIALILIFLFCTGCAADSTVMKNQNGTETVQLYCVDSDLYKLIPYDMVLDGLSAQESAERIVDELVYGMRYEKIRHIIPEVKNGVTVRVEGDTAYVNFSKEMVDKHPADIDSEMLTVYSIVNSLASLDAVTAVKFTIDGKVQKDFKGFLDMRETFLPDYMV